jgi:hypothetical protein
VGAQGNAKIPSPDLALAFIFDAGKATGKGDQIRLHIVVLAPRSN